MNPTEKLMELKSALYVADTIEELSPEMRQCIADAIEETKREIKRLTVNPDELVREAVERIIANSGKCNGGSECADCPILCEMGDTDADILAKARAWKESHSA